MKYLIIMLIALSQYSCGSEEKTKTITDYLSFPEERRLELVNQNPLNINTNHEKSTSFVEEDYGMILSLFSDGKFYYKIEGLGEGAGFWKYKERGYFHLHANYLRSPNGLNFFIISLDEQGSIIDVVFDDRFGVQRKRVKVINLNKRMNEA